MIDVKKTLYIECFECPFSLVIGALILAWFLTLFGIDTFFVKSYEEITGNKITKATYYMFFFSIAIIAKLLFHVKFLFDTQLITAKNENLNTIQMKCEGCDN